MHSSFADESGSSAGRDAHGRGSWVLAGTALLLGVAFVVAPVFLAGGGYGGGMVGSPALSNSAAQGFVAFWRSDGQALPAGMDELVQYWMRYHIAKAALAGLWLVVLTVLATRLWKSFIDGASGTRHLRFTGVAGTTATVGGLAAAVLLMANVQGAIAPLSSVLSLVPSGDGDPAVGQVKAQVVQQLQADGRPRPALAHMIGDFGTYHAVLAASAVVLACATVAISVLVARSFMTTARSDRAVRRRKAVTTVAFATVGICVFVLAAANIGNAIHPAHALLLFYTG